MIEFENYKSNLDVIDKYDVSQIKINKGAVYTGNTDYINKQLKENEHNSPLLGAAVLGLDNTAAPFHEASKCDIWTDIDAQEIHLDTKPTCYLIFGKAGTGAFTLGEALAKKLNCIHLCPKNILTDETLQNSTTGRTLDFNMKHNKVCSFEIILTLLKIKLNSTVVQHRGYVISDLPLVTCSRNPLYLINSLHSEEAFLEIDEMLFETICNLKKNKPKKRPGSGSSKTSELLVPDEQEEKEEDEEEQPAEEIVEEEEEKPAELPKFLLDFCTNVITVKKPYCKSNQAVILYQLQELFNLCLPPDIIIHITCPDLDLVRKRSHKYINYTTGQNNFKPFVSNFVPELGWHVKYDISDYENPHDSHVFQLKYNCRPPMNFEDSVVEQVCNYKRYVFPYMQKKMKDFDPKMIIELDGRTSVHQMLHHIAERLILLPIQPVIIPEPLHLEEPPEDMQEFWTTVAGLNVIRNGVVKFTYYSSPWYNRCPVELKLRRSVAGTPKYGVKYFKHVYLLSSLNHFISFCKNPRPFLKIKYLEPPCRIIITGTKTSGKSMVSQCLSWIFETPIICYKTFLYNETEKKYDTYAKTILSEIIATIEDARFLEWQRTELDRSIKLNEWCNSALELLNDYVPLLIQSIKYDEKNAKYLLRQKQKQERQEKQELKGEEEVLKGEEEVLKGEDDTLKGEDEELKEEEEEESVQEEEIDPEFLTDFNDLRIQLSFLPILDSINECKTALESQNVSQYAPIELTTLTDKPTIPVMGDEDVTKAISEYITANDLQKEIEPTTEELMTEIVKIITTIDTQHQEETHFEELYGKYIIDGFPSDPEYWEYISDLKLIPDYTIALIENREIDQELYQYYTKVEKYIKHYDEKILSAKDPLIHTKLQVAKLDSSALQHSDMQIIVNNLINDTLDFILVTSKYPEPEPELSETDLQALIASFNQAIEKFREDWDNIKLKLEEKSKSYIEIELENKTDVIIIEEMLLKLRQCYCSMGETNEDEEAEVPDEDDDETAPKDLLNYNDQQFLCETNIYCPTAYYDYDILWEGKPEFSLKLDNKVHYFCKEEFLELFRKNITKYQFYNKPFKKLPKLKICILGCIGSGASTLSKQLAKEFGLLHINFADIINNYMMPRHFKKVGRQYENMFVDEPIDEEAVVEFQMDEENLNLVSDILANEVEMRRMVNNYFERGTPILPVLMQNMIKKIWFDPFVSTGFVLDNYPRIPNDVEDMLACYCIPDMVIVLENTAEVSVSRMGPKMFNSWKSQQNEAKNAAKIKLNNERKLWMDTITKKIVIQLIIEEIVENMFFSQTEAVKNISVESVIMDAHPSGSANVDPILFNTYNEMVQEFPEPVASTEWEKSDEARERIEARIEGLFETDEENFGTIKDILMENKIKTVTVDATKPIHKVFRYTLSKLSTLKNRCESFFEQTFIVSPGIAEMLILRGFYFLSKFNRLCPVYIFENPRAILNSYKISRRKDNIFPIIHRSYIYFISNKENIIKFRTNPLKYVTSDAIKCYFEYPLRIGVIGTPKSGRSTLAAKLAKENGLICISRGKAVRSVLKNLHWTELASVMSKYLREGKKIDEEHIVKAIQTVAVDHRTVTYGFVFDGFPNTPYEAKGLVKSGLYPNIIFDISSGKSKILENSQKEIYYDILKYMPPYPYPLIKNRYEKWIQKKYRIRSWIAEDYQNLCQLDGNQSRWHILQQANDQLMQLTSKIHYYMCNVEKNIVHALWISNEAFEQRQTQYKKMCPVCFHKNVYRHMGYAGDKKGVVQYENKFYWICEEHLDLVMMYPHCYLFPREIKIPELPTIIKVVNTDYVYENGICVVTYADNLPAQKIQMGTHKFAASYCARRVPVPDERFDYLCEFHKPASKVPAFLNVVDIAGLVRGAAEGQGLGNAFLSHIKACDAIFNLCRAFDDEDVIHVDGEVNPVRDLETIGEELRLKDEEQLVQNFEKLDKVVSRGGDKKLKPEYDSLTRIKAVLVDEKKHIRFGDWSAADIEVLNKYLFLTSKPALYLVNLSEKDYIRKKNKWLPKLKEWIDKNDPGAPLIPFSGVLEMKLLEMEPTERTAFLKEHNLTSALDKIIVQGYKALQLEYFFTAGPDEVKAWTIQKGTKAPQAAGRIHTDFEKGFIMAEVMHYKDFKEEGTEAACKAAGKYRQQGRNYVVEDGDIIFFKFNAGAGLKDAKKK